MPTLKTEAPTRIGAVTYLNTVPLIRGLGELLPGADVVVRSSQPAGGRFGGGAARRGARAVDRAGATSRVVDCFRRLHRLPRSRAEREAVVSPSAARRCARLAARRRFANERRPRADSAGRHPRRPAAAVSSLPLDASPADVRRRRRAGDRRSGDSLADARFVESGTWATSGAAGRSCRLCSRCGRRGRASMRHRLSPRWTRHAIRVAAISRRSPREQSAAMGLPYDLVLTYLRDHLHFYFGAGERRGLDSVLPARAAARA